MKDVFNDIYKNSKWQDNYGTASGPGSSIECSHQYLNFLKEFVINNSIKSILDLGCGDFNLMKHFDFSDIQYLGVDLVTSVIDSNNKNYSDYNIKFEENDIISYKSDKIYDLVIVKDVLQHLNNHNVIQLVNNINFSKHSILVNDFTEKNIDSTDGGYRAINLTESPFFFNYNKIFEFNSCGFQKCVYLST